MRVPTQPAMAPTRIDELTARYAENPRRYFAPLANEYRKAGDAERAVALCRVHLPTQPGHMSGHVVLGQALVDLGDLVGARAAFATAVALDDENLVALRQLGDIARAEGDLAEARGWYARVLDADPMQTDVAALQASLAGEADGALDAAVPPVAVGDGAAIVAADGAAVAPDGTPVADADLDGAAASLADAPLPPPSPTPFPGGIGFSDEELDAFIAHVPLRMEDEQAAVEAVRGDEANPPADPAPASAASAGLDLDAMVAGTSEGDAQSDGDAGGPVAEQGGAVDEAMHDLTGRAPTELVAEIDDAAVMPLMPSGLLTLSPIDEGLEASAADAAPPAGEVPGPGEAAAVGGLSLAGLPPVGEWGEGPVSGGDDALPIVDIGSLAPDESSAQVVEAGVDAVTATAEAESVEADAASDEAEAEAVEADAASDKAEAEAVAAAAIEEPTAVADVVETVEPAEPVAVAVAEIEEPTAVAGVETDEAPEVEPDAVAVPTVAAPAPVVRVAPPAARPPMTPVRSAAIRLLASLAPWRDDALGGVAATEPVPGPDEGDAAPASEIVAAEVSVEPPTVPPDVTDATVDAPSAPTPAQGVDAVEVAAVAPADEASAPIPPSPAAAPVTTAADVPAATPTDVSVDAGTGVTRPTPAGFTTATMAELYRRQGFLAESLAVYRELAQREPADAWYAAQVASLEAELAAGGAEAAHEVNGSNTLPDNEFGGATSGFDRASVADVASLTPPGFGSIAAELGASVVPGPSVAMPSDDADWFEPQIPATPPVAAGADDWFGDGADSEPATAFDEAVADALFGMDSPPGVGVAMPTPVSLDALGGGLDELFGMPMVAAADQTAAQWLEALGGELVGRPTPGPLDLPVPSALDVPVTEVAPGVPAPLLSFDRFFGATPPGVRRQEDGSASGAGPVPSLAPSFGGTPLLGATPVTPQPPIASTPFSPVPPPPEPPRLPASPPDASTGTGDDAGAPPTPPSDFHRWLEGLQ